MENHPTLKGYLDVNGKFAQLPGKRQKKKQAAMLEYLAAKFVEGKKYTEVEVNEILNQHHSFNDPATLRRLMFGSQLINRTLDGRTYWVNPKDKIMQSTTQIAKHFRDVFFGGNWTTSNLKTHLAGITWQQATSSIYNLNSIAQLTYHIGYYVSGVLKVLEGGKLEIRDKYSFDHPSIQSQEDWESMLEKIWFDVEKFASKVELLPDSILLENFEDEKYGNYFRNLHGIIEHCHYHLGQIVLIKKILQEQST